MGYFCLKNTFLQLKRYTQRVYLTFLSSTCLKIHQIPYIIFETISHFSQHNFSVFFSVQSLHSFYKSSPSKCKFSDFLLLALKFTKFVISFLKQKVRFSLKFGSFFSVMRHNSSLLFHLNLYMLWTKRAHQSANIKTVMGDNSSVLF